jgi:hypothetical protein
MPQGLSIVPINLTQDSLMLRTSTACAFTLFTIDYSYRRRLTSPLRRKAFIGLTWRPEDDVQPPNHEFGGGH